MISPQQNTRPGLFADIHVQYKLADEDKRQLPVRTGNGGLHLFSNGAAPNTLDQFPLECRLLPGPSILILRAFCLERAPCSFLWLLVATSMWVLVLLA